MAEDWTTRELALAQLETNFATMHDERVSMGQDLGLLWTFKDLLGSGTVRNCMDSIYDCLAHLLYYMIAHVDKQDGNDPLYLIPYIHEHYTAAPNGDAEITWQQIIRAWGGANDAGRMWTITSIDQMRQNIWNKDPQIKWNENPFED